MNDNISLLFFFCLLFSIPRSQENLKTKVKGTCMCYSSRDQSSSIETKVCFYTRFNNILSVLEGWLDLWELNWYYEARTISTYNYNCNWSYNFTQYMMSWHVLGKKLLFKLFFLNVANAYKEKKWSYNFLTCTFSTTAHSCCRVMTPHSTWL